MPLKLGETNNHSIAGRIPKLMEIFVVIKDGNAQYYLLKVMRHGFDIYCIPPHLGVHYSLHESGESHFRHEEKSAKSGYESPMALVMGEAGTPSSEGIIRASLSDLGRAAGICTAVFSIDSLSQDFQTFNRSGAECFVIDTGLFPKGTDGIEVGVWAVPARNKASFEFNNPNILTDLLHKVAYCEPQIWVYARPF
jgi:hypothetical protein